MRIPNPPFFEIGPKCYICGDDVFALADAADAIAEKYDVDILFTAPYLELREVRRRTKRLFVGAPHMDLLEPGRGITKILPEGVVKAGADYVLLNHAEHPLDFRTLKSTMERARSLDLMTVVCADSLDESLAVAGLHPDVIIAEPSELIGTGKTSDLGYIRSTTAAIKRVDPEILVLQAAGISTPEDVYRTISAGADATGTTSGVVKAKAPIDMLDQMICALRKAFDER